MGINERPILFSTQIVPAILAGRKTMTRRVMKPQPHEGIDSVKWRNDIIVGANLADEIGFAMMRKGVIESPAIITHYGLRGDLLWVRETWRVDEAYNCRAPNKIPHGVTIECAAAPNAVSTEGNGHRQLSYAPGKWRPSIFMMRWMSRITLEITNVRAERLQEIPDDDAKAEGITQGEILDAHNYLIRRGSDEKMAFKNLWDSINGKKYPWVSNPFVWVIEFKREGK